VVLVIVILAMALIAALIFYVFNMGQHVTDRVETQHAADSAAISGAGWVARSLNTVAANNVQSARLISLVNVLDASDEALHPAYHEADKMYHSLEAMEPSGGGGGMSSREASVIGQEMRPIIEELREDYDKLLPMKRRFAPPSQPEEYRAPAGSLDVTEYTFYNGGNGHIWQAIDGLGAYSQATMENVDELSQLSARQMGKANLDDKHGAALMVPHLPRVPWKQGRFDDFERPVTEGLLPKEVDDERVRRGPFDVLFGWRDQKFRWRQTEPGVRNPRSQGDGPSGPGGVGPGGRLPGEDDWLERPQREKLTEGYFVYGTHRWMKYNIRRTHFEHNPYFHWRDQFANWKQQYLFDNKSPQQRHLPIWRTEWSRITGAAGGGKIVKSRYFTVRIESEVPESSRSYLSGGTYRITTRDRHHLINIHGDWSVNDNPCHRDTNDPREWQPKLELWREECPEYENMTGVEKEQWASANYEKIGDKAWRFGSKMIRTYPPPPGEDEPVEEKLYQYVYYFLIGVDVGKPREIRDPHTFQSRSALPGPVVFDRTELPTDREAAEDEYFTYLGIAQEKAKAALWSDKFDKKKPYPATVAIAQARVFNNHSEDLWTQMWHAQLEPVQDYGGWVERFAQNKGAATKVPGLDQQTFSDLNAYMKRTEDLAEAMLSH
jgi:hypothetical protein